MIRFFNIGLCICVGLILRESIANAGEGPFTLKASVRDFFNSFLDADALFAIRELRGIPDDLDPLEDFLKNPALRSVTTEFGPSKINVKGLPYDSAVLASKQKAWSSFWYPIYQRFLFDVDGGDAALEKYDDFRQDKLSPGLFGPDLKKAAEWEAANNYRPGGAKWEGHCDAWSMASILHGEPVRPISRRGVDFTTGDLKALLIKSYENVDESNLKFYGMRNNGNPESFLVPDIFANEFHRFIEIQMYFKKKAFLMDHDPGPDVWTVPVYKANYKMVVDPTNPRRVIVRTWLYNAAQLNTYGERDKIGTTEEVREYNYILEGDYNAEGKLVVKSGKWIKGQFANSIWSHPDYLITIPDPTKLVRKSRNPEIDPAIVDEIVKGSFDPDN